MAINKNIEASNYGIASKLLDILIPKNLPDKLKLEEKQSICAQNQQQDRNVENILCKQCNSNVSVGNAVCNCGSKIRFCFKVQINEIFKF